MKHKNSRKCVDMCVNFTKMPNSPYFHEKYITLTHIFQKVVYTCSTHVHTSQFSGSKYTYTYITHVKVVLCMCAVQDSSLELTFNEKNVKAPCYNSEKTPDLHKLDKKLGRIQDHGCVHIIPCVFFSRDCCLDLIEHCIFYGENQKQYFFE